ncbi:MAG: hypothetical protein H7834_06170 [Magnetococcus sp. YQC-9]
MNRTPLGTVNPSKPRPVWDMQFFLMKKKRWSGRFLSQGFAFAFSALFKRTIFRVFCEKCAARRQGLWDCFAPFAKQSREHGPRTKPRDRGFKVE